LFWNIEFIQCVLSWQVTVTVRVADATGRAALPFIQWHPVCLEHTNGEGCDQTLAGLLSVTAQDNLLMRLKEEIVETVEP